MREYTGMGWVNLLTTVLERRRVMALRSLYESYTLPARKLESYDHEASARRLCEFMSRFKEQKARRNSVSSEPRNITRKG